MGQHRTGPRTLGQTSATPRFERLQWLRARIRRYSQRDLDRAMGWTGQTTAQIESGVRPPPDRATCAELDAVLGLPPGTTWRAALDVHLARRLPGLGPALSALVAAAEAGDPDALRAALAELLGPEDPDRSAVVAELLTAELGDLDKIRAAMAEARAALSRLEALLPD